MSRIDVHQHLLPPAYTRWLKSKNIHAPGGRELPPWSPQHAIALMDTYAIETAVLSGSGTSPPYRCPTRTPPWPPPPMPWTNWPPTASYC